ncbi:MAG: hypothetical protein ACYCZF_16605 [Anaerolineae bacterium]
MDNDAAERAKKQAQEAADHRAEFEAWMEEKERNIVAQWQADRKGNTQAETAELERQAKAEARAAWHGTPEAFEAQWPREWAKALRSVGGTPNADDNTPIRSGQRFWRTLWRKLTGGGSNAL